MKRDKYSGIHHSTNKKTVSPSFDFVMAELINCCMCFYDLPDACVFGV